MRWACAATVLLVALCFVSAADAQPTGPHPPTLEPQRETLATAILGVAGTERTRGVFSAGGIGRISVKRQRFTTPPDCPVGHCVESPRVFAHALGAVGVNYRGRFAAQSQLGLVYKTGNAIVPFAGIVAQYQRPYDRVGPALRVDVLDNLGITAGWIFGSGDGRDGFYLGIDLYHEALQHVGLF